MCKKVEVKLFQITKKVKVHMGHKESESVDGLRIPCSNGEDCRWYLGSVGSASWEIRGSADLWKTLKLAEAKNV